MSSIPKPDPSCPTCAEFAKVLASMAKQLTKLEAEVKELKARKPGTSRNSSRPPSSDPPWAKPKPRPDSGARKPGGQIGHEGSKRDLLPPDEVHVVRPEICSCCGEDLLGVDRDPYRHQVVDVPPIRPRVTEFELHTLSCHKCGATTRASLPVGVPSSSFGPNLSGLVATLTGGHRISRRNVQQLLADVFGVRISLGGISNIEARVSRVLEAAHAQALRSLVQSSIKHLDETGWRESNASAWLWTGVGDRAIAFLIRASRGSDVARELIGDEPEGTLITDRWSGYNWVDIEQRQVCWAHLIRDFRKIADSSKDMQEVGEALEANAKKLFRLWHLVRDATLDRRIFRRRSKKIRIEMRRLLRSGSKIVGWDGPRLCRGILKLEQALWTFVSTEGVEPTNNDAERAVRPGVLWRKSSLGTQSDRGSRYAERIMTCAATLKRQGRGLHRFIVDSLSAEIGAVPAPQLLG